MAFQQGLSGLNTSSKALDVISNNIANASTVGFKGGQAQFADVYAASLGVGGGSLVGIGASVPVVQQQFSQGNISNSNNPLDIAVNGSGFFRMQKNATDQTITYTRNGQFHLNELGYIVNAQGNNLTGYPVENNVTNRASLVPVKLDTSGVVPRATGASSSDPGITTQINLDDRDLKSLTSATPDNLGVWTGNTAFPPNDLNTFNYSTSVTIYDQKGNDHALSIYFTRVGNSSGVTPDKNLWETHYVLDNQDITSCVVPAATNAGATGVPTLEFLSDGTVRTVFNDPLDPANTASSDGTAVATDYKFNIDVGLLSAFVEQKYDSTVPGFVGTGSLPFEGLFSLNQGSIPISFDNSTLFGSGYDVNKLTQDGYPYGRLSGVSVSPAGILTGNYSNGQTKQIAQIALADFIAPTGLISLGNNQWQETAASGQALIGDPGTGNRGVLQSAAVEDANVDLTQELVNLITFQRNYQANAQSIKTQDQVMQTLVNLR